MAATRRLSLTFLLVAPLIAAQDSQAPDLSLSSVSGDHLPNGIRSQRPKEEDYDDQEEIGTSTTMDSITSSQVAEEDIDTSTTMDSITSSQFAEEEIDTSTTMDSITSSQVAEEEIDTSTAMDSITSSQVAEEEIGPSTIMDSIPSSQVAEEKFNREKRESISTDEGMDVAEQVVFRPYFRHRQTLADRKLDREQAVKKQSLELAAASGQAHYPYQYNYYYPLGLYRSKRSINPWYH